jgi:hypothetical protein
MGVHRRVLADFAPHGRAGRAYAQLWDELRERIGHGRRQQSASASA